MINYDKEVVSSFDESYRREWRHFYECITEGKTPFTCGEDARKDKAVLIVRVIEVHQLQIVLRQQLRQLLRALLVHGNDEVEVLQLPVTQVVHEDEIDYFLEHSKNVALTMDTAHTTLAGMDAEKAWSGF